MNGSVQLERADLPFLYLFVVFGPSVGWMVSTHIGEDDHLYSVYQFKCSSLQEIASQTHLPKCVRLAWEMVGTSQSLNPQISWTARLLGHS